MPEEGPETKRLTLMGPPRVRAGADGPEVKLGDGEKELLALLVVGTLLLPPDGVWREIRNSQGAAGYEVGREWLVETLSPAEYALEDRRQAARDRVGYLLDRMHPRGVPPPPLSFRLLPSGESRERGLVRVTWRHLDSDLAELLEAAKNPHGPAGQEKIMALAVRPLLEGMAYPWLQRPEFRRAGAHLDAAYLAALCGRADSLLVLMENARTDGRANEVYSYRTKVLPLLDRAADRLQGTAGRLDAPELEALRQFPPTLESLRARASYLPPTSPQVEEATDAAPSPPNHNLPSPVTSFVGREQERQDIRNLLLSGRLVTLTGMGGCGKTRLAVQTAWELLGEGDNVRLVELAALADSERIPQTIATALGVAEQKGLTVTEALIAFLQGKRTLLLLDNCEHLLLDDQSEGEDCGTFVAVLLHACPTLSILATSRKPLNIDGEYLCPVSPLPFPTPDFLPVGATDPVAALLGYDAAQLFVDRVFQFQRFALEPENVGSVAAICAALDGIPLSLELAAARMRALSLEEITKRLSDPFGLLTHGRRESPARHKTLRAVIDWSFDLLDASEQGLFCRLSVFAGGWTLDAAEAVGSSGDLPRADVLNLLESLVDKSLIIADLTASPSRYRMLETVRQYAEDRLRERGEWEETRRRHRDYFLALAEEAPTRLLKGPEQKRLLDRLEMEIDNLRAALGWRADETSLRLACDLSLFWWLGGYLEEGRKWLEQDTEDDAGVSKAVRARTLIGAGRLAYAQSRFSEAKAMFNEDLALRVQLEDDLGIAKALFCLGEVASALGKYEEAKEHFRTSLTQFRKLEDKAGIANALMGLGMLEQNQGQFAAAEERHRESLALRRELGETINVAGSLMVLGNIAFRRGALAEARLLLEEGLGLLTPLDNKQRFCKGLIALAGVALAQGHPIEAQELLQRSLTISQTSGNTWDTTQTLNYLAIIAYDRKDYAEAETLFTECLAMAKQMGAERFIAALRMNLAVVAGSLGRRLEAEQLFHQSLREYRGFGDQDKESTGSILRAYGLLIAAQEQSTKVVILWGATEAMWEVIGFQPPADGDADYDQAVQRVKEVLAPEVFASAWEEGRAMSWEQAVAFALGEDPP